jgi:peptidoglycan/xylan/chitin deacetylase (PgdA/CDA1 family)
MSGKKLRAYRPSVLVYHHISLAGGRRGGREGDAVQLPDFERQMRILRERRFHVATLSELVSAIEMGTSLPARTVAITFDDGYRSTYTRARPVLSEYGLAACVFLATDSLIDTARSGNRPARFHWLPENEDEDGRPLSWQEAEALLAEGIEVGSHTASHGFPAAMAAREIERELLRSREKIEARLGLAPFAVALPFSFPLTHRRWPEFKGDLLAALKRASYKCCCTLQRGPVSGGDGVLFLPRVAVKGSDSLRTFYAKALGLYRYTNLPQRIYQAYFKRYR